MMQRKVLGFLAVCALVACKDGDDGDVESAAQGWRAASKAMQSGQEAFESEIAVGAEGTVTASCPDGGEVTVDGRMDDLTIFALNIAFDACQSDGVRVDGELSLDATVKTTETSAEVSLDYVGHLELSGEVEMSCSIDATGYVATSSSGGKSSAEVRFSGEICGADANAVVKAST